MKSIAIKSENLQLETVANEIRERHDLVQTSVKNALVHAIEAGRLLMRAKKAVPYGRWLPWLNENCRFGQRMAQNYMVLAKQAPLLLDENPQRVADLTVRRAVGSLQMPKHTIGNQRPRAYGMDGFEDGYQCCEPLALECEKILTQAERLADKIPRLAIEADKAGRSVPVLKARLANNARRAAQFFIAEAERLESCGSIGMPCD
jgi:hypothetical protein